MGIVRTTYDIRRSWSENAAAGPVFWTPEPEAPPEAPWKAFLGIPVRSRIGIAAGLLLNSRWLLGYARRGWDILTYKTVRSAARPSYPPPNWVFVEEGDGPDGPVYVTDAPRGDLADVTSSVCFGMPSAAPGDWRPDVRAARAGLAHGQMLVVSVVGTPGPAPTAASLAADFARCAAWAVESGAHAVEANLSCPNVCTSEGTLYHDPDLSRVITREIRAAIGPTPLLLKVGAFPGPGPLAEFLRAVDGLASGITLVNGVTREVLHRDGRPAFGPEFRRAGVLGRALHEPALNLVRETVAAIRSDRLSLAVAAVGGVASEEDIARFLTAGADAVVAGSSPMYLPDLAADVRRRRPDW